MPILEAYYEPQFRDSSHGFRPRRSCHTALRQIKRQWKGTKWFIEGDIKGCYDNISHQTLLALLGRNIHDNRFLKLIHKMLRAGYIDDWKYNQTYSGTPQGGIASPIMSNVVLHELDAYVEDILIPSYTKGKRRKATPEYTRMHRGKRKAKREGDRQLYKEICQRQRLVSHGDPNDPDYRRLRYIRYADDFLLGFSGPKTEAQAIMEQIGQFLDRLKLQLSEEKTFITHARTKAARFLSYDLQTMWDNTKIATRPDKAKIRSVNGVVQLRVPPQVCAKWIKRYTHRGKTHQIGAYIDLSDYEIISTYGAQLRGLVNYYSLADNVGTSLQQVRWYCMESARKTLTSKHRIGSVSASHKRYYHPGGKAENGTQEWSHIRVTVERKDKKPFIAKCGETPLRTQKIDYASDKLPPTLLMGTRSELTTRLLAGECELCGIASPLEAHHVNKLKNLRKLWQGRKEKPKWVQWMIARHRKVIVVCHSCHQKITHGRHDGRKLE